MPQIFAAKNFSTFLYRLLNILNFRCSIANFSEFFSLYSLGRLLVKQLNKGPFLRAENTFVRVNHHIPHLLVLGRTLFEHQMELVQCPPGHGRSPHIGRNNELFIDIGAKDKEDAEKYVKLGDYVTFDTEFMQIGSNVKGKALDRSGICTSLINAVEKEYKYDTYMCFLVQREVGARGAKIVSHRINADVILSVSSAETADMYGCESNAGAKLGDGAVVNFADRTIIADKEITEKMVKAAKKAKIKVQSQVLMPQTSDGGAMQSGADGAICLSASVPCRYSHSPVSVMSLDDINSMTEYIRLFLNKIGEMV